MTFTENITPSRYIFCKWHTPYIRTPIIIFLILIWNLILTYSYPIDLILNPNPSLVLIRISTSLNNLPENITSIQDKDQFKQAVNSHLCKQK